MREGLSIPEKVIDFTSSNTKKYNAITRGVKGEAKSWVFETAKDVHQTMGKATSKEDFIKKMNQKGYEVTWEPTRKNITFKNQDGKKVRNETLSKTFNQDFGKDRIENEIRRNAESKRIADREKAERKEQSDKLRAEQSRNVTDDRTGNRVVEKNEIDGVRESSSHDVLGNIQQQIHDKTERIQGLVGKDEPTDRQDGNEPRDNDKVNDGDQDRDSNDNDEQLRAIEQQQREESERIERERQRELDKARERAEEFER